MIVHYVTGYGRSGSTTLGRVLAQEYGAIVMGEAWVLRNPGFAEAAQCSCGDSYRLCPYWASVAAGLKAAEGNVPIAPLGRLEGALGLLVPMRRLRREVRRRAFGASQPNVTYADGVWVLAQAAGGAVVDTSKTTRHTSNRPRLMRATGLEVRLYQGRRPLQQVVHSHQAARIRQGGAASRTRWRSYVVVTINRFLSHRAARVVGRSLRQPLQVSTIDCITHRFASFEENPEFVHLIAGNRSRRRPESGPDDRRN